MPLGQLAHGGLGQAITKFEVGRQLVPPDLVGEKGAQLLEGEPPSPRLELNERLASPR